jgi:hypothetical protein
VVWYTSGEISLMCVYSLTFCRGTSTPYSFKYSSNGNRKASNDKQSTKYIYLKFVKMLQNTFSFFVLKQPSCDVTINIQMYLTMADCWEIFNEWFFYKSAQYVLSHSDIVNNNGRLGWSIYTDKIHSHKMSQELRFRCYIYSRTSCVSFGYNDCFLES